MLWLLIALASAKITLHEFGRTATEEDYWSQWLDFKNDHGKLYSTFDEHSARFHIFKDNIDKINRHNELGLSWTLGVTPFADLTPEEFKNKTLCMGKPKLGAGVVVRLDDSNNPASVDWVAEGKVTAVKNQAQCGSCWAFSTTGAIESRFAIANNSDPIMLSEQELVDCSGKDGNNGCNGGLMDYGFEYVVKEGGLCTESSYPYVAKTHTLNCRSARSSCDGPYDQIKSFTDVTPKSSSQLETAVAQGPVSIAIEADQTAFQLYKEGVFTGRCGKSLDHGVLAVGYGVEDGQKFWKVKNSWGEKWGESGYIRLCKECDKNRGAGQCGILSQPSFPVV